MYYDITNPDASYYWLHELLQMQSGEFIEEYIINCHNDFEEFFEKYMTNFASRIPVCISACLLFPVLRS